MEVIRDGKASTDKNFVKYFYGVNSKMSPEFVYLGPLKKRSRSVFEDDEFMDLR